MQKKIAKSLARFRSLPHLNRVDLEIRAVMQHEEFKGYRINIEDVAPQLMENLVLNYLRHNYFTDYERHCLDLHSEDYLEMLEEFTNAVSDAYPWLAQQAHSRLYWKRRDAQHAKQHPLDRKLNQILLQSGIRTPIASWKWFGTPNVFHKKTVEDNHVELKLLPEIATAKKEECESSASLYVKGCKEWLEEKLPIMGILVSSMSS